ncbi:MAG TPA: hypothetical protein VGQ21_07245 [Thermoanaerobaculia bacterium]|jgi:hypothetical protein|nr:hypothetical protein [Thermoanaerobaculia bacterium]
MPDAILNDLFSQTQSPAIVVDDVLGQILGVQLDGDIGRFRSALARAFPADVNAATGATSIRYVAPSSSVLSQSGTIPATGALAGIQAQTSLLSGEALTVLARLRPMNCACDDGIESLRDLIRRDLAELPALFAQDAGPMSKRIDMKFLNLTGVTFVGDVPRTPDPACVRGQIETLGKRLGFGTPARTIEHETMRTDFRTFVGYVWMLQTAWAAVRSDFDNAGADSLGINVRRLYNRLNAIRSANAEVFAAFDAAHVGPAERMTFTLECEPPITLADLLAWIDEIASAKGLAVIAAGQDGIATVKPVVDELLDLVCNHLKPLVDGGKPEPRGKAGDCLDCGDATFLSTHRTKAAVNKLALQLTELCRETKRALQVEVAAPCYDAAAAPPAPPAKRK